MRETLTAEKVRLLASDVTIKVGALRSRTLAPAGVLPLESSTIRRGFRPFTYSAFTVSFGSSFRTVPIPTRTASAFARSAWTRRRSSSLLNRTGFPPESAIFPSTLIAALMTTCGRTSIRCAVRINNLCGFGAKFIYRAELRGSVRSHEGSLGPRRRPALPSDRRRNRGNPIRCRRSRDPAGSESRARRPPLRDGPRAPTEGIQIYDLKRMDLRGATVIDGFPSVGLVSSIVANYLINALNLVQIGIMDSVYFPTVALVSDGQPMNPVRIYAGPK